MLFSQRHIERWSFADKLTLRFLVTYIVLYILLLFLSPVIEVPLQWFAEYILHWGADFKTESTGSGDRAFDYVRLAINVVLTLIIVVAWTMADKKRLSYNKLFYWFQVLLRVTLFVAMFIYGLAKVMKGQFADPSLLRLLQPVGDLSPMGLAWTFMGHSFYYSLFIGFTELLGGMLVLFRKTLTLGSLIIVGVMTNVAIMNFTYDIPVKLLSTHLVLMALILLLTDSQRILKFFFKNETAEKADHYVPNINPRLKKLFSFGKKLSVALIIGIVIIQAFVRFKATNQLKEKSNFYGIWEAELFVLNNDTIPPLLTDSSRWRYLVIDQKMKAVVKKMTDDLERYKFENKPDLQQITFTIVGELVQQHFSYQFIPTDQLYLKGVIGGDSLYVQFKRKPETDFLLLTRGFHWVNETAYNP